MASINADINGFITPLQIDDRELNALSLVRVEGDKSSYRIEYGNGLVEVGGIKEIRATVAKEGVVEGTATINTGLSIISAQATALNVGVAPAVATGEGAFMHISDTQLKLYATAIANSPLTMSVMWSVKGVENGN